MLIAIPAGRLTAQIDSDIQAGFNASPPKLILNLRGLNLALVARGSYLVNGPGNCSSCHTAGARYLTGGNPFNGETKDENITEFLGGKRSVGGILSRNLTPDASGLPAGLAFEQFKTTLRTGADQKGLTPFTPSMTQDLLQNMPWPQYQNLTDYDLRAIYEYLKAIPCVNGGPGLPIDRCGS
jgi:hypothetical protein